MNCAACAGKRPQGRPALHKPTAKAVKLTFVETWVHPKTREAEEKFVCPVCHAVFWFPALNPTPENYANTQNTTDRRSLVLSAL